MPEKKAGREGIGEARERDIKPPEELQGGQPEHDGTVARETEALASAGAPVAEVEAKPANPDTDDNMPATADSLVAPDDPEAVLRGGTAATIGPDKMGQLELALRRAQETDIKSRLGY